jgi:hypothetical protein
MIGRKHAQACFHRAAVVGTHVAEQIIASCGERRTHYSIE